MSGTKFQDRDTDPLVRAGQRRSPAYGLQGESEESEISFESGRSSIHDILKGRERVFRVAVCCLTVCLASLLSGVGLGFSSATILELNNTNVTPSYQFLSSTEQSLFAAFFPLGAIFGGLFAFPAAEILGRHPSLIIGGIPTISGWLMITYAWFFDTNHQGFLALLLLGRFFTGFAAGWSIFCVSVYITEVASATLKGLFGNCNQLFITIGALIAYGLGAIQCSAESCFHYYYVSLVPAGIVVLFEFFMLFTYESPRWLYKKATRQKGINKSNSEKEANRILNVLRGPRYDVPKEIRGIKRALQKNYSLVEQFFELKHRSVYVPFILVLFLMFFQQFSGINAAIFFAGSIFESANVQHVGANEITAIAVGLVQVLATLVSVMLVDWRGRKQLLVVSSIGMCVSSALLGTNYVLLDRVCHKCFGLNCTSIHRPDFCNNSNVGVLAIVSVIIFIVSFSLAWGPIPWTSMSELVPGRVRTLCGSIATVVNWSFAVIITAAFQSYSDAITPEFAWWSFSIIMFASIFFVVIFIPEAKGHLIEEIEDHFENGKVIAITCKCSLCMKQPQQPSEGQH